MDGDYAYIDGVLCFELFGSWDKCTIKETEEEHNRRIEMLFDGKMDEYHEYMKNIDEDDHDEKFETVIVPLIKDAERVLQALKVYDPNRTDYTISRTDMFNVLSAFLTQEGDRPHNYAVEPYIAMQSVENLARMLNIDQGSSQINQLRHSVLDRLERLTGRDDLTDIGELPPMSEPDEAKYVADLMNYFERYDPYNFKEEELGYGQKDKKSFVSYGSEEKKLNYKTIDMDPVFRELHRIMDDKATPMELGHQAYLLILDGRDYFMNDPIEDMLTVFLFEPGKECSQVVLEENEMDKIYCADPTPGPVEFGIKDLGLGVKAVIEKDAKLKNRPKNRILYNSSGQKLGVVRGNLILFCTDYKGNRIAQTEEQREFFAKYYSKPHFFKEDNAFPVSAEKAQILLANIVKVIGGTESGYNRLKSFGLTENEIDSYMVRDFTAIPASDADDKYWRY